jgi:methionyl-tRNA formyltransferase
MKIFRTQKLAQQGSDAPMLITSIDGKPALAVSMPDGILCIHELQLAGKKRMSALDFLRGTSLDGWKLA